MIIFCGKNYYIQKGFSLRLLVTQNGYWNNHLIPLKPKTKTVTPILKTKQNNNDAYINNLSDKIVHNLELPYKGDHGINLIKSVKTSIKKTLPEKHNFLIILTWTKLRPQFNIKDNTNKQYKHD